MVVASKTLGHGPLSQPYLDDLGRQHKRVGCARGRPHRHARRGGRTPHGGGWSPVPARTSAPSSTGSCWRSPWRTSSAAVSRVPARLSPRPCSRLSGRSRTASRRLCAPPGGRDRRAARPTREPNSCTPRAGGRGRGAHGPPRRRHGGPTNSAIWHETISQRPGSEDSALLACDQLATTTTAAIAQTARPARRATN